MFESWRDHPPTNVLLKALLDGLSAEGKAESSPSPEIPLDTFAAKAGLSISRDDSSPTPVFDLDAMRARNQDKIRTFAKRKEVTG